MWPQSTLLTSTSRSLTLPAPRSIGEALNVGGANTIVSRIASENDFSSVLIVRTVDNLPFPMVQREGAETRTSIDCHKKRKGIQC